MDNNSSARYHQKKQGKATKKASRKVSKSFQRIKSKKGRFGHERYRNLPELEKKGLIEHRNDYFKMRKNCHTISFQTTYKILFKSCPNLK